MASSKSGNKKHGILCFYVLGMEANCERNHSVFSLGNCVGTTSHLSVYIIEEDKTYVINGNYMIAKSLKESRSNYQYPMIMKQHYNKNEKYSRYSDEANIQDDLIQFIRSKNVELVNCDIIEGSSEVRIVYKDWLINGKSVDELIKHFISKVNMLYGNDVACAFKIVAHGLMVCDIHSIKRPLDNLNIPDFCLCCCCSDSGHRVKNVNLGKYTINVLFKDYFTSIHGGSYGEIFSISKTYGSRLVSLEIPRTVTQISWNRLAESSSLQELIFDEDFDTKKVRFVTLNRDSLTERYVYTSPQSRMAKQEVTLYNLRTLKLPRSIDSTGVTPGQFGNLNMLEKLIVPSMNSANEVINSVGSKEQIYRLYERVHTHSLKIELY